MNITVAHIIVFVLAVWRISSLFVRERGPFDIFVRLRTMVGIQHDDNGLPWMIPDTFFAQLLGCVWCFSLWAATFFAVWFFFFPQITFKVAIVFAFSGGAILLDSHLQKSR